MHPGGCACSAARPALVVVPGGAGAVAGRVDRLVSRLQVGVVVMATKGEAMKYSDAANDMTSSFNCCLRYDHQRPEGQPRWTAYIIGKGRGDGRTPDEAVRHLLAYLSRQPQDVDVARGFAWLDGPDTGLSSRTICRVMMGHPLRYGSTPRDPADLGRCIRLLDRFPAWRDRLGEVAARYPEWRGLVEQWPALEESYRRELPTGDAPETYALMKAIEEASR